MNLTELFDASLVKRRREPALEFQGERLTFGDIEDRSNRLAHVLAERGLRRGDRLCVYLANCVEMIDAYLACIKLGIIFIPINILYRDREISHILADSEPKAVITDAIFTSAIPLWQPSDLAKEAAKASAVRPHPDWLGTLDADTPAAIVYTSGTTGTSKGAILTHGNFAANASTLCDYWRFTSADRLFLPLPLFHVHGLGNGIHCWLASGCQMRLLKRFEHQTAAQELLDFAPTVVFGVPTIYVRVLGIDDATARKIGQKARLFVCGSAPLPPQVLEDFRAKFGHTILERYGMTEALMITSNPYDGERRAGTVGLALPGISVRVLGSDGKDLPDGDEGELYVKGPSVFPGYWKRPEPFVDGYFRTGDIGRRSPDGYYTISGRKSDLIISGGFNIYPREIEEFLQEQDEVAEAAVVGRPDAVRGEIPVAYLVVNREVAANEIERRCRESLASFKIPRRFEFVDKLPRNAMGKIQKHLL